MEPPEQPLDDLDPAPCTPDSSTEPVYDSARNGRCANGHPLNSMGRCAVVNGQATHAELVDALLVPPA
jgi:hypothetical protein